MKKIVIAVAAVVLLTVGGYAGFTFLWPLLAGSTQDTGKGAAKGPPPATEKGQLQGQEPTQTAPSGPTATGGTTSPQQPITPPSGPTTEPGKQAAPGPTPTAAQSTGQPTSPTPKGPPTPPPKTPTSQKTPSPQPKQPAATQKQPPPKGPDTPGAPAPVPPSSLSRSYELLRRGNLNEAADGYLQHLRSNAPDKFTIAVGVYCDSANVTRAFEDSGNSDGLIVLPYQYKGRSCYRVFWGLFDSREAAVRGVSSVPPAIRAPESTPVPTSRLIR